MHPELEANRTEDAKKEEKEQEKGDLSKRDTTYAVGKIRRMQGRRYVQTYIPKVLSSGKIVTYPHIRNNNKTSFDTGKIAAPTQNHLDVLGNLTEGESDKDKGTDDKDKELTKETKTQVHEREKDRIEECPSAVDESQPNKTLIQGVSASEAEEDTITNFDQDLGSTSLTTDKREMEFKMQKEDDSLTTDKDDNPEKVMQDTSANAEYVIKKGINVAEEYTLSNYEHDPRSSSSTSHKKDLET
ncbi:uncharacterized protein LOC129890539 [Solanum dulcamara]|uniref:uncharacterized protein LOC129890539 n=1 Tax=Solanum dulcamara TaxID=45834 RepID=UPI002484E1DF|nr:uncharacterized protein LOC129890539 [Solanum dulcamara]